MMPEMRDALLAVSGSPAASIAVKATLVAAMGLVAAHLARGSRAAVRHALLAATFAALAALPAVYLFTPPIHIALETPAPAAAVVGATATDAVLPAPAEGESAPAPIPSRAEGLPFGTLLFLAWGAGAALFLIPAIVGAMQVNRLRRNGLPWRPGQTAVDELALRAGVARRAGVFLHEALAGPMACGALRPAIALPMDAREWSEEDLSRALVHELEHVRRGDWAMRCFARAVCAAYWFHPLVWMAWRRLALEAERACDDAVLAHFEATGYADQLVSLAGRLAAAAKSPLPAMAGRADLTKRVGALLDERQRRGRAGAGRVAAVCAGAVALVLLIAPLATVAAPQPMEADSAHFVALAAAPVPTPLKPVVNVPVARRDAPAPAPAPALAAQHPAPSSDDSPALLAMAAPPPAPQNQGVPAAPLASLPHFRAESNLVIVDVAASYPNGTSIGGLTASDFTVTEDGASQAIKIFEYQMPNYVLGYYATNTNLDGSFRKIEIALKGVPGAKLDYGMGYTAGPVQRQAAQPAAGPAPPPGVTLPQLLHKFEPEYSDEARKAKFQGTVVTQIAVQADGTVGDVKVLRSLGMGLDDKAVQAVKQWRYAPGTQNGVAVPMWVVVEVNFRLF
jgi:TonB family protein